MKVNRGLINFIRDRKKECESCDVQTIETIEHNEWFTTEFYVASFNRKFRWNSNYGRRSKTSCIISGNKNESYTVIYYDENVKHKIILYPAGIKRVVYKTKHL